MATIRFVCGADIAFGPDDQKFACQPMGICETALEAAQKNSKLHSSFGYAIYKVDVDAKHRVTLCFGILQGRKATGLKVLEYVGQSYDILEAGKLAA